MKTFSLRLLWILFATFSFIVAGVAAETVGRIETTSLRVSLWAADGHYEIQDKVGNVTWRSNPFLHRFGEVTLNVNGKQQRVALSACEVKNVEGGIEATFQPLADRPADKIRVSMHTAKGQPSLEISYEANAALSLESIRMLEDALWTTDNEHGYVVVPTREGLLIPADNGVAFTHRFDTSAYEGCHMEMFGVVKGGAAALVTWHDPYIALELKSALTNGPVADAKQVLAPSLSLRKTAKKVRVEFLGQGDYVAIGKTYRKIAAEKGWLVTWDEKLKGHPERAKLFGAINYKLWSTLSRTMNEDSTKEQSARVNWTFDEAAQVAEHLKNDLKLDKVFFIMGGWIRRGYDNQHPDILPAAPECGGDKAFSEACAQIRQQGYLLGLHDNYQDMYKDAPSWDESFLQKNRDGTPAKGGKWAGGLAYLTCSEKAVELAKRPQNLEAVRKLSQADAYFIDTTYAAGLQECFDPKHPLTRWDDMKWKQTLSDYGREVFGIFGSECGREWAIPHSDFFEGFTGVSGGYYHDAGLMSKLGASVIPLFEIVYRDCIAMYGKYGYDPARAAEYVLHHIIIGRTLNYHSIPSHLYWKDLSSGDRSLKLTPLVTEFKQLGSRQFSASYAWKVESQVERDWRVLVHFTDAAGKILFQNDYEPTPATSQWKAGEVKQGPFTLNVPEGLNGPFDVRIGLFRTMGSTRAQLATANDNERRCIVGKIRIAGDKLTYEAQTIAPKQVTDTSVFVRADGGWAEGLHVTDRFVKNTYEILSPLNELTSSMRMTEHQFLTPDRKVQRSLFGEGANAVEAIVNMGTKEFRVKSKAGTDMVLPAYGFLVESPAFVAFHALNWNGLSYEQPAMFTLRSTDGKPLKDANAVRVFHAFGDPKIKVGGKTLTMAKEAVGRAD